jgi:hypothetical protein
MPVRVAAVVSSESSPSSWPVRLSEPYPPSLKPPPSLFSNFRWCRFVDYGGRADRRRGMDSEWVGGRACRSASQCIQRLSCKASSMVPWRATLYGALLGKSAVTILRLPSRVCGGAAALPARQEGLGAWRCRPRLLLSTSPAAGCPRPRPGRRCGRRRAGRVRVGRCSEWRGRRLGRGSGGGAGGWRGACRAGRRRAGGWAGLRGT